MCSHEYTPTKQSRRMESTPSKRWIYIFFYFAVNYPFKWHSNISRQYGNSAHFLTKEPSASNSFMRIKLEFGSYTRKSVRAVLNSYKHLGLIWAHRLLRLMKTASSRAAHREEWSDLSRCIFKGGIWRSGWRCNGWSKGSYDASLRSDYK